MNTNLFYIVIITLLILSTSVFAQNSPSNNDIILRMKNQLNLKDDQVANITQIMDRYSMATQDLQKSIDDGTINPSAIDSQKEQIKAAEEQGLAQYLNSDQLSQWKAIMAQMNQGQGKDSNDNDADQYSNMPSHPS